MEATKRSPMIWLKWLIAIVIPALLFLIPVGDVFTAPIRLFFVVTLFMMIVIALELVPILMSAIFLPALYILLQIAPAETALSAWTKPLPFMLVGAFILAMGLAECGLLQRLAYGILAKTGGTYRGILLGILAASLLLTFMTSGSADTVMVAFVFGICVALKLGNSKTAAGITMVSAICCVDGCLFIFKPSNMSVLIGGAQSALGEGFNITYAQFFLHNWPWIIALVLFVLGMCKFWKPDLPINGKEYFQEEYKKLGKMSPREIKGLVISIVIILLLLTTNFTGFSGEWILALVPWVMFIPGISVATEESIKGVKFPVIFFAVACMSIGFVAGGLGIGPLITQAVTPLIQGLSNHWLFAGAAALLGTLLNFLLTPLAMMGVGTAPLVEIASSMGIDPLLGLYAFYLSCNLVFLPYESTAFLVFYSFGTVKLKHFAQICAAKFVFFMLWMLVVMIPYWNLIGVC